MAGARGVQVYGKWIHKSICRKISFCFVFFFFFFFWSTIGNTWKKGIHVRLDYEYALTKERMPCGIKHIKFLVGWCCKLC